MEIFAKYLISLDSDTAPDKNVAITINNGIISDLKPMREPDIDNYLVLPGLINNHIHLSYERALYPVETGQQLSWMQRLVDDSRPMSSGIKSQISKNNIRACLQNGITTVVDNTPFMETVEEIIASPLRGIIGYEAFGIDEMRADYPAEVESITSLIHKANRQDLLSATISPHSIYTVGPKTLQTIAKWAQETGRPFLLHLAEFWFESELTEQGFSPQALQEYHEHFGSQDTPSLDIRPLSRLTPVQYLDQLGILEQLGSQLILTHMVNLTDRDIALITKSGAQICSCPRSNALLKNNKSRIPALKAAGINVSFATDGLSSNYDLDLLEEIRAARLLHPEITAKELLRSITTIPAQQINLDKQIGSIKAGKQADLVCYKLTNEQIERIEQYPVESLYEFVISELKSSQIQEVYIKGAQVLPE